jgi:hypothetical protein
MRNQLFTFSVLDPARLALERGREIRADPFLDLPAVDPDHIIWGNSHPLPLRVRRRREAWISPRSARRNLRGPGIHQATPRPTGAGTDCRTGFTPGPDNTRPGSYAGLGKWDFFFFSIAVLGGQSLVRKRERARERGARCQPGRD